MCGNSNYTNISQLINRIESAKCRQLQQITCSECKDNYCLFHYVSFCHDSTEYRWKQWGGTPGGVLRYISDGDVQMRRNC